VRRVRRSQTTQSEFYPDPGPATEDDVYSLGLTWKPIADLTLRGNLSTSVRSASLVELFSAPSSGFSNPAAGGNPCTVTAISQGPDPATRRANCLAAVQTLGIAGDEAGATTFLSTFTGTGGSRPAAATGNPFLLNEKADAWSAGLTWQPSFVPGLALGADYIRVTIEQEIGLYSPADYIPNCFDDPTFPASTVSGTPVCDLFTFGAQSGGQFIVPAINPLTGNPVAGGAPTGSSALIQNNFETAFFQFPNFNLGKREMAGVNVEARYAFALESLFGAGAADLGRISLRGSLFYTEKLDLYANGQTVSAELSGQRDVTPYFVPKYQTRFDMRHTVGDFSHTVQWFWYDNTVDNTLILPSAYPDQSPAFFNDDYSYFNYNAAFEVNDTVTLRLTVNNLTDEKGPNGRLGDAYDTGVGREWILGVNMRF
jgi:outer membrane receptor protein involved in Fe transport